MCAGDTVAPAQNVNTYYSHRKGGSLCQLPIVTILFQRVGIDIVSPSTSCHKYILVVSDYATHYPEAVPSCNICAEMVACELAVLFTPVGGGGVFHGQRGKFYE